MVFFIDSLFPPRLSVLLYLRGIIFVLFFLSSLIFHPRALLFTVILSDEMFFFFFQLASLNHLKLYIFGKLAAHLSGKCHVAKSNSHLNSCSEDEFKMVHINLIVQIQKCVHASAPPSRYIDCARLVSIEHHFYELFID